MRVIKHIRTGEIYNILHSEVLVKNESGVWIMGFAYYKKGSLLDIYVRSKNDLDKFEVIE